MSSVRKLGVKLISVFMRKFELETHVSFHVVGEEFGDETYLSFF
jgi:hypothetical protein